MNKHLSTTPINVLTTIYFFVLANDSAAETTTLDEFSYTDLIGQLSPLLAIPFLVYILFNKKLRLHFLWNRIIGSPIEANDKKIRKELRNQQDLEQFRSAHPNIKVDNIYEVRAIIGFCKEEKIDVSELSDVPISIEYDENKNPVVHLPNTYGLTDRFLCWSLIILMLGLFLLGAAAPFVSGVFGGYLFKMKETSDYIWLAEHKYALKLSTNEKVKIKLSIDNCSEPYRTDYNMTENEFSTMCNVLRGNKEDNEALRKIKSEGIWLSSFLCSITGFYFYVLIIQLKKINKTIKILQKIASKNAMQATTT